LNPEARKHPKLTHSETPKLNLKAAQVLEKLSEEALFASRDKKGWRLIEI
jgi:hypothetical protein